MSPFRTRRCSLLPRTHLRPECRDEHYPRGATPPIPRKSDQKAPICARTRRMMRIHRVHHTFGKEKTRRARQGTTVTFNTSDVCFLCTTTTPACAMVEWTTYTKEQQYARIGLQPMLQCVSNAAHHLCSSSSTATFQRKSLRCFSFCKRCPRR